MAVGYILLIHNLCCIVCNVQVAIKSYSSNYHHTCFSIYRPNFSLTQDITCSNHYTSLIYFIFAPLLSKL